MADAAEALYPNGPSKDLGNQDPSKVLGTFSGNHEAALLWGEPKHREAYVSLYGPERAISIIDNMMEKETNALKFMTGAGAPQKHLDEKADYIKDLTALKNGILEKQGY